MPVIHSQYREAGTVTIDAATCTRCGACVKKCPYGLDTPELLVRNYEDYREILAGKVV